MLVLDEGAKPTNPSVPMCLQFVRVVHEHLAACVCEDYGEGRSQVIGVDEQRCGRTREFLAQRASQRNGECGRT